jgi:hypothetical protein
LQQEVNARVGAIALFGPDGAVGGKLGYAPLAQGLAHLAHDLAALGGGQDVFEVHAFPFRMTEARMYAAASHRWLPFWEDLKPIYDAFEETRTVPQVKLDGARYTLAARP